jgi:hypothetical protein
LRSLFRIERLVPDVALATATATLFYSLFVIPGYQKFFRDSDAGWHIRSGERMLRLHELPRTDPFSFTMAGSPWFAWEWGSDVLVGTIHQKWGLTGIAFFYGCTIAAGVWLWFRLNWLSGGNFLFACFFAAPMLSTSNLHWLARPHVISWIFLLGLMLFAEYLRRSPGFTAGRVAGVAVLCGLWANLHASFIFATVIFTCYAAGLFLGPLIWETEQGGRWQAFAGFALVSALVSLLNPYGWHLHQHVLRYLTDSELLQQIGEFQTFNFHAEGTFQIFLALGISILGGALALYQKDLPFFFLAALLIVTALRTARGLPLMALLLLPLANGVLTRALRSGADFQPAVRRGIDSFLAYSGRLQSLDSRASGLIFAPVIALIALTVLNSSAIAARTGFPTDQFPVAASASVEALPADARILAPDKFGGYLIYRFDGSRKVFFDGRSDLYGAEFLKQYGRLMQVRPGWQKIMEPYHFTHALLPDDSPLTPALQVAGWKTVYRDSVCILLSRD